MNSVILFGQIHYKNKRAINFARSEYTRFTDTIAKNDLLFKPADLFGEDPEAELTDLVLNFERSRHDAGDKTLANTERGLEVLLQFAIAGRVDLFYLDPSLGVPDQVTLGVDSDKSTVQYYLSGRLALEERSMAEAETHFTATLDSYAKHVWALDGRAEARLALDKVDEAHADWRAARELYPKLPNPHYGLARIAYRQRRFAETTDHLKAAMKNSIPHQAGYWIAALFQADVLLDEAERRGPDQEQVTGFLNSASHLLERYHVKLRQLGNKRTEHYPSPERHEDLVARHAKLSGSLEPA